VRAQQSLRWRNGAGMLQRLFSQRLLLLIE